MNKKQLIVVCVFVVTVVIISVSSFAVMHGKRERDTLDKIAEVMAESERKDWEEGLKKWSDQKLKESLSDITLTDDYVEKLYKDFKAILVTPPNPETYTEYSIENAEHSLVETENLGRKLHNLLSVMSDKDFQNYGKLIMLTRDILYIDWIHIPYAIKHNNGRDIYWYKLHKIGVEQAEKEYSRLF